MRNWWEFGEWTGYEGHTLGTWRIRCAFCGQEGNFGTEHHVDKRGQGGKVLNYDILACGNCGNYTMVFWSAARGGGRMGVHDYKVLPWPLETTDHPEHWPKDVGRNWVQARRSLEGKNWDAAAVMARSGVQLLMRYLKAEGRDLYAQIEDLGDKGLLPPVMREWSHEVRALGNESAHPRPGDEGADQRDANDVVEFLTMLLNMTYDLPHEIEQYRKRRAEQKKGKK